MIIRLKTPDDVEVNLNINAIVAFIPHGSGSAVRTIAGESWSVKESCRSIRHAIKKAAAPSSGDTEG